MACLGGVKIPVLLKRLWSRHARAFSISDGAVVISPRMRDSDPHSECNEGYLKLSWSHLPW